jgi:hypothetical protein
MIFIMNEVMQDVVLVRRTDVSEERIASVFSATILRVLPARRGDVPHDGRRREPLLTAGPQLCLAVTVAD